MIAPVVWFNWLKRKQTERLWPGLAITILSFLAAFIGTPVHFDSTIRRETVFYREGYENGFTPNSGVEMNGGAYEDCRRVTSSWAGVRASDGVHEHASPGSARKSSSMRAIRFTGIDSYNRPKKICGTEKNLVSSS